MDAECGADDHAHRHIDHIAAQNEFAKSLEHDCLPRSKRRSAPQFSNATNIRSGQGAKTRTHYTRWPCYDKCRRRDSPSGEPVLHRLLAQVKHHHHPDDNLQLLRWRWREIRESITALEIAGNCHSDANDGNENCGTARPAPAPPQRHGKQDQQAPRRRGRRRDQVAPGLHREGTLPPKAGCARPRAELAKLSEVTRGDAHNAR